MNIGETGQLRHNPAQQGQDLYIEFTVPLTDPLIACEARGKNNGTLAYQILDETLDHNGDTVGFHMRLSTKRHKHVTLTWCAVTEGTHHLANGVQLQAGHCIVRGGDSSIAFEPAFKAAPLVLLRGESAAPQEQFKVSNLSNEGFRITSDHLARAEGARLSSWIAIDGETRDGNPDKDAPLNNFVRVVKENSMASQLGTGSDKNFLITAIVTSGTGCDGASSPANISLQSGLMACFAGEARIATLAGHVPAQELNAGDKVMLPSGGSAALTRVLKRTVSETELETFPDLDPVVIRRGALGQGLPQSDLRVSPQYRLMISSPIAKSMFGTSEVLVSAEKLTALPGVYRDHSNTPLTYVHLVFESHKIIYVEGAPAESLMSGKDALAKLPGAARAEMLMLFPELGQVDIKGSPACATPSQLNQGRLVKRLMDQEISPLGRQTTPPRVIWLQA